jgi:protocatechuate 3,4-dioxygenase beta subunit
MTLRTSRTAAVAALSATLLLASAGTVMAQTPPLPADPTAPPRDTSARPPAAVQGTGTVRGRVVAADTSLPLRRVTVSLSSTAEQRGQETDTDADGAFTFEGVPKGRYRLKASKARYVDTSLGARLPGRPGRAFEVGDGQKIEGISIRLAVAGVITGRVLDDAGEPVAGAPVLVLQRKRVKGVSRLTSAVSGRSTDDTGAFRVFGLAPGRYYLSAVPNERHRNNLGLVNTSPTSLAMTYYPSTPVASEAQPLDVAAGTETTADIALVATQVTTVSGEVLDSKGRAPIAGFIHLISAGHEGAAHGFAGMQTMSKSGAFTLSGVAPGDYTLNVRAFFDEEAMLRVTTSGAGDGGAFSLPLSVSGTPIGDLRIVIPPPGEITGRVHFEGEPPAGGPSAISILAWTAAEHTHDTVRAQVGANGRFTLQAQPGSWRFAALAPRGWMVKRLLFRGKALDPGDAVELTGEPDARLDVLMTSQLTVVTGTASDPDGAPLLDYHVVMFPADEKDWPGDHRMRLERADAQGRFRLEGAFPGDYWVAAASDIEPNEGFDEEMLAALRPGATRVRVRDGQTETVALKLAPLP